MPDRTIPANFSTTNWDKNAQLRHAGIFSWPKFLIGGRRGQILRIQDHLQQLGCVGCMANLSGDSILKGWMGAGWIEVSPNRTVIRLKTEGEEQLARWQEE